MDSQSAAESSTDRDPQSDPNLPQEKPAPGRQGLHSGHRHSHHVESSGDGTDIQQSPTVDMRSERPNNAIHLRRAAPKTSFDPRKDCAKSPNHTSSADEMVTGSSRVEGRDPLPSSRKNNLPEDGRSPHPDQSTFTCETLDCRTQLPCGKVFTRRTTLRRHQKASFHNPEKRGFQCVLCVKKYVFLSVLKRHVRNKHGWEWDPNAKMNSSLIAIPDGGEIDDPNGRSDLSARSDDNLGSRASGNRTANPGVQTGRVEGRYSRSGTRQPAGPSGDTSRHSSRGSTTTVPSFHETNGWKSSDNETDDSLPSRQQPQDSSRTVLICKLRKAKTGKVCNKIVSRTNAKWARSALKTHQKSSVHRPEKRKSFKCNQCDRKYSFPEDLKKHKRKAHGVGVRAARAAKFSDEESDSSADEQS